MSSSSVCINILHELELFNEESIVISRLVTRNRIKKFLTNIQTYMWKRDFWAFTSMDFDWIMRLSLFKLNFFTLTGEIWRQMLFICGMFEFHLSRRFIAHQNWVINIGRFNYSVLLLSHVISALNFLSWMILHHTMMPYVTVRVSRVFVFETLNHAPNESRWFSRKVAVFIQNFSDFHFLLAGIPLHDSVAAFAIS